MAKAQKLEKPLAEWGSDVVVDLLKVFEIEYIAINPSRGRTVLAGVRFGL